MARKIDYKVNRKYFMSKKKIYGVENELNIVEHIHKALNAVFNHPLASSRLTLGALDTITADLHFKAPRSRIAKGTQDWEAIPGP
jgi:hypothetical protein